MPKEDPDRLRGLFRFPSHFREMDRAADQPRLCKHTEPKTAWPAPDDRCASSPEGFKSLRSRGAIRDYSLDVGPAQCLRCHKDKNLEGVGHTICQTAAGYMNRLLQIGCVQRH